MARRCFAERGMARFEVLGRDSDRELVRSLARRLAEDGPEARRLRVAVTGCMASEPPRTGGILAALRRSPSSGRTLLFPVHSRPIARLICEPLSS